MKQSDIAVGKRYRNSKGITLLVIKINLSDDGPQRDTIEAVFIAGKCETYVTTRAAFARWAKEIAG